MERLSLIWKCCEVRVCVFMGEGEGRGNVGEWDCKYSLKLFLFFLCLHHQWMQLLLRCCQTISCLHSCTPVTFSLQENGGPWFYSIFSWCQSLCNTRFVVFSVFFFFFHFDLTNASWEGQYISQSTTLLCVLETCKTQGDLHQSIWSSLPCWGFNCWSVGEHYW